MSKKNEGKAKLGLLLALMIAFVAASVHAYTVKRSVDADGTQIFLLEDSGNLTIGGTLTAAGAQTITSGDLTVTAGDVDVTAGSVDLTAGWFSEGVQDATLADAGVLTPTAGYITVNSDTGIITNTIAASATIPLYSHIYLHNDGTGTVTVLETGTYVGAGSLVLAAEDTAHVLKTATNVYTLIGLSNN